MKSAKTRRLWLALTLSGVLLLGVALAGNTGGSCAPIGEAPLECTADSDCSGVPDVDCDGAWQCVEGGCVFECGEPILPPEPCRDDADCAAGEFCAFDDATDCCAPGAVCLMYLPACEGVCRPIEEDPFECRSDADCARGTCVFDWDECPSVCDDSAEECVAVCGPPELVGSHCAPFVPGECAADSDCPEGMACEIVCETPRCSEERCIGAEPICFGQCVPVEPPPEGCRSNDDCAAGEICLMPPYPCADEMDCLGMCVPDETECLSDADCPEGMYCQMRWDLDAACCPPNAFCDETLPPCGGGVCVADDPWPYPYCESDADCAADEYCAAQPWMYLPVGVGICQPRGVECVSDADCGEGMRCEIDWTLCPEPECPDDLPCEPFTPSCGGVCVADPQPECWSDADCGVGLVCRIACEQVDCAAEDCTPVDPYCWGVCVPAPQPECWSDGDCPAGFHCEIYGAANGAEDLPCAMDPNEGGCFAPPMGVCVADPPPECWSDANCPAGFHCEFYGLAGAAEDLPCSMDPNEGGCMEPPDGVCVPDPVAECAADWDCAADERCEVDYALCQWDCGPNMDCLPCVGRCVPIKECLSDSDCPGGTICDFGEYGCWAEPCAEDDPTCGVALPCMGVCREPEYFDAGC